MQFEHLIQINDVTNPLIPPLTRAEVWSGLVQRVENPRLFLPGLEQCTISERGPTGIRRRLDFGTAVIEDRVTLEEGQWVRFEILPGAGHVTGSLTILIEVPQENALFLRFLYQTSLNQDSTPEDQAYSEYIKSAYHQSDIDTVRVIRSLVENDSLQSHSGMPDPEKG